MSYFIFFINLTRADFRNYIFLRFLVFTSPNGWSAHKAATAPPLTRDQVATLSVKQLKEVCGAPLAPIPPNIRIVVKKIVIRVRGIH